jgi:hypothetical protein
VTFRLTGNGPLEKLTLPINPEEIQRNHPARITTTQTLGGAFQDIDGEGVAQVTIQGTTGWRGRPGAHMDGMQYAQHLFKYIYKEYLRRATLNPSKTELLLINGIDGYAWKVSMDDFQMTRSRSEPLIFRYMIPMTPLQDVAEAPAPQTDSVQQMVRQSVVPNAQKALSAVQKVKRPPAQRTYKVQSGDSLWTIADQFYGNGTDDMKIARANHIPPPYTIYAGQILVIP